MSDGEKEKAEEVLKKWGNAETHLASGEQKAEEDFVVQGDRWCSS